MSKSDTPASGPENPSTTQTGQTTGASGLTGLIEVAVERQNDVLLISEIDGIADRIVYANAAITQHTGYSPEEVIGNTPRMFQGPDTSPETRAMIRKALDAFEPIQAEILNYRKDGTPYWTEMQISPIFDNAGQATHMVSVQRDVTEKKARNAAVRRKDERFLLALEASANAIWEWTIKTDRVEYRDETQGWSWHGEHHGHREGQGLNTLVDLVHPDDRDRVCRSLSVALDGSDALYFEAYRFRRPDGSYAEVSDRQVILRDPDGQAERVIGSILDTSEKYSLENRMPQFQRLELLGEMTSGIAHNFNNLLTVILGNVDRLRDGEPDQDTTQNTIRMIDEAAQRGAALTDHLMSFSQVEKLTLEATDIQCMIDAIEPVWRNLLPPEIHLDIQFGPDLRSVQTDPAHLEAAILNLVINARDAMPDGGDLSIRVENLEAGSELVRSQDGIEASHYVVITVADTGTGMPPEDVASAFDPFFTTKAPGKGTGLGLSSAYGFIRQSGGFITLESTVGRGTTINLFVRVADDAPAPSVPATRKSPLKDGGHRILVVDDDALVREYVQTLLVALNYKITTAANGAEALQLLAEDPHFDLLFTDILMEGGMSGLDLARQTKALYPDLPILFTSAYPDLSELPLDGPLDTPRILRKPYRARDLSVAVMAAINTADLPRSED